MPIFHDLTDAVTVTVTASATDGKSASWPNGEPKSVRDAYDVKQATKKK